MIHICGMWRVRVPRSRSFDVAVRRKQRRGLLTEPSQPQARPARRRCDPGSDIRSPKSTVLLKTPRSWHPAVPSMSRQGSWPWSQSDRRRSPWVSTHDRPSRQTISSRSDDGTGDSRGNDRLEGQHRNRRNRPPTVNFDLQTLRHGESQADVHGFFAAA